MTLGCSLSAILVLQTIATEKEAHLLASLRVVGLREWVHWTSWALCYFFPCFLSAVLSTICGLVLRIRFFVQCDVSVQLLNMFLFLQSFAALATFLGSFISRTRMVVAIALILLFLALVSATILTAMEASGFGYHYGTLSGWASWAVLSLMPWFHFQRIFADVATAAYQPDTHLPQYFHFHNLSNTPSYQETDSRGTSQTAHEYSTGTSLFVQLFLVLFYNVGAWYVGQVASVRKPLKQFNCTTTAPLLAI